jgi:hypothetical protein
MENVQVEYTKRRDTLVQVIPSHIPNFQLETGGRKSLERFGRMGSSICRLKNIKI